jgi:hypothetical protein
MKNRKTFVCRKSGGIVLGHREKFEGDIEVIETENKFVLWCKISSKLMKLNSDGSKISSVSSVFDSTKHIISLALKSS